MMMIGREKRNLLTDIVEVESVGEGWSEGAAKRNDGLVAILERGERFLGLFAVVGPFSIWIQGDDAFVQVSRLGQTISFC